MAEQTKEKLDCTPDVLAAIDAVRRGDRDALRVANKTPKVYYEQQTGLSYNYEIAVPISEA